MVAKWYWLSLLDCYFLVFPWWPCMHPNPRLHFTKVWSTWVFLPCFSWNIFFTFASTQDNNTFRPTLHTKQTFPYNTFLFLNISMFPSVLHLIRATAHQWWREQKEGGMEGVKGDGWIMSDHKRVGLHRAFSPSGLSAAPGSNIHLAWCIPGPETLM